MRTFFTGIGITAILVGAFFLMVWNLGKYYRALDDIHEIRLDIHAIREDLAPKPQIKFRGGRSKLETPEKLKDIEV